MVRDLLVRQSQVAESPETAARRDENLGAKFDMQCREFEEMDGLSQVVLFEPYE